MYTYLTVYVYLTVHFHYKSDKFYCISVIRLSTNLSVVSFIASEDNFDLKFCKRQTERQKYRKTERHHEVETERQRK